jgi:hypothetical protein
MSERKPTPDVLADILGSGSAPSEPRSIVEEPTRPAAPRRSPPDRSAQTAKAGERVQRWEYIVVSFQDYRGWRPRFEGGIELSNWMRGPLLPDYLKEQGTQGWELVTASAGKPMFGVTDCFQLFFRRPIR